ncbi:MAG: gamma-glutamylcyclotransferase [Caldilineaceae bacterium]|nr:gamma-glutamylcyclotransferase [Caldilineaceae bacterium]
MNSDSASTQPPLFVYGTLRPGQRAFPRYADAVLRTRPGILANAALYDAGRYPIAAPASDAAVRGEIVWLATADYAAVLQDLDEYEGDEYARVIRTVRSAAGKAIDCWVYLGDAAYAARYPRIPGDDWIRRNKEDA